MQLSGRVAAVTGGTSGIGLGIARTFLAEGASVTLMSRNPDKGQHALAELGAGDRCDFLSLANY